LAMLTSSVFAETFEANNELTKKQKYLNDWLITKIALEMKILCKSTGGMFIDDDNGFSCTCSQGKIWDSKKGCL